MPDIALVRPLLYSPAQLAYYEVGPRLATAFSVGKAWEGPEAASRQGVTVIVPSMPGWIEQM